MAKSDSYHLSFSIGKALWDDLTKAALPLKVADGQFDVTRLVYRGVKQLQVREKVVALLEDREAPPSVVRVRERVGEAWRGRRPQVVALVDDLVRIEGDWKLEVDRDGTEFRYAQQQIGVDAHVKAVASGRAILLRENLEVPFTVEKRLGAECHLGNIRYDKELKSVVGDVADPSIDLGEHVILKLLNDVGRILLEQQVHRFRKVPILKREQVEGLVAPAGGPLKLKMGVDDVLIEVTDDDLTLRVRFGFTQMQLDGE